MNPLFTHPDGLMLLFRICALTMIFSGVWARSRRARGLRPW